MVKNPFVSMQETQGIAGSIPWLGRSPGEGMATHSSILDWRIPWTEKPGRLQSMGSQESDMTEQLSTHTHRRSTIVVIQDGDDSSLLEAFGIQRVPESFDS